ncbi:hypothetical protein [Leptospira santarosai]|uniref:hypothetical protein n=1 Tax=Leptospira santarosai TaxID=28183 RepID=UPI0002BF3692|nr:hypothetical protein [Leptospira santarosai]EMP80188.1 hypothetical protein LEP1GSC162_2967 [Leptospira santarosai str. CBC1531]EMJ49750.1 hypothetical protein LEP1GSC169_0546 [Leptospira santarosai str. HAI1349]EMO21631.1 hypothetical protein LEP1GSC168_1512 [Leptospira santarosai str. HAI134]EMO32280.1 hypothetical protein LEP1GSC175_0553 [Leptospira santarosai str. HAI821]MDI7182922.1 hypothetical protein [Leptospira santarosai]
MAAITIDQFLNFCLIEHLDQKSAPKPEKNKFERIKYLEQYFGTLEYFQMFYPYVDSVLNK